MSNLRRRGKVLLATRNEMVTLPLVLEEITESAKTLAEVGWILEVVIVDDSDSPDVESELPSLRDRLGIKIELVRGNRSGLGAAIIQGFRHCLRDPATEFIVNLDADGQHDARQMGDLLRIFVATGAGITIGSRWAKGGRCYGLSFSRKILSRCSSLALRHAGVPKDVMDPTTSFRVYRRDVAEILIRETLGFNGFSFFGAGVAVSAAYDLLVNETPIHFRPRVGGQSSLSFRQTWRAMKDLRHIRSYSSMIRRREAAFCTIRSDPKAYTASRELEQLSNTPTSTKIIVDLLSPDIGENVLEVGAGLGQITAALLERGRTVTALEPDPNLFGQLIENVNTSGATLVHTTLAEWPAREESEASFDTALYVNVLEHIQDDIAELRVAAQMCTPAGNIVIFVPATPSLYGTMDWMSAHFRRYRKSEIIEVVKTAGLNVEKIEYFDLAGKLPYLLMYRTLRRGTLGSTSVGIYDRILVPLSNRIPKWITKYLGGKNLIVIARKNYVHAG